ncbi:MAG: Na+/H+ antiporter [Anaerolineales bacterium]|nr:MAG: Na+/H+ antiporter [Anaerolineales bacterium]
MAEFLVVETLVILLLLVVSIVAIAVRRIRLPYTVALVLVGLFITFRQELAFELTPELILAFFVPPLIFEAAFHLEFNQLRDNLAPILILAVPGVVCSTLIVGGILSLGIGLPLSVAAVFGALISATDPVAVVAFFRALGVSRRLAVAVEGESLFNDGTAIVVFNIALAATLVGSFDVIEGIFDFLRVALGGLGIGMALGWVVSRLIAQIDDYFIEITLTTVLAYGAYLVAEQVHVSGVLAVVAAGIVSGNMSPQGMSPTTKIVLINFWEYLAFLANSLVFLLIGIKVNVPQLVVNIVPILAAVGAVLVSRAIVVYGMLWLTRLGGSEVQVPLSWRHVLFWGGLRGAIGLALALSLPLSLPQRELLEVMAFGVVLFTLLAQGTTLQFLLRHLGLTDRPEHVLAGELRMGRLFAARAGLSRLADLRHDGLLAGEVWAGLRDEYDQTSQQLATEMAELFAEHPELEREVLLQARREALRAERGALSDALRQGLISEVVYRKLTGEVDRRLEALALISEATAPPRTAEE